MIKVGQLLIEFDVGDDEHIECWRVVRVEGISENSWWGSTEFKTYNVRDGESLCANYIKEHSCEAA